jgi:3-hydroxyisobutyryl-CoA hydrolase
MTTAEHHLLVDERSHCRTVTLNRPKALNALNLDMCSTMKKYLQIWSQPDSRVGLIIMKGAGEKAFCAGLRLVCALDATLNYLYKGGDVRSIWQKIHEKKSINEICEFFKVEYQMNYMLATSSIPQVNHLIASRYRRFNSHSGLGVNLERNCYGWGSRNLSARRISYSH